MNEKKYSGWKWCPHWLTLLSVVMVLVTVLIAILADAYPVPDDAPMEIPLPDHGENIPGPEWLFLLFWLPFWYFVGRLKRNLFIMTLIPILGVLILIFLPYFHKLPLHRVPGLKWIIAKAQAMKSGFKKSFVYAIPVIILAVAVSTGVYKSGHQAKVLGCDSCHNPAMGPRMAIPPVDVFGYYSIDRARQIKSAKYRAGKSMGTDAEGEMQYNRMDEAQSYKDANWQMRHMYEPTFTW